MPYLQKNLFKKIKQKAKENNIENVIEGSNTDDDGDYRPGMRAVEELGIKSPLKFAGLTKAEIRNLSKNAGLPTAAKPSFACLASRFVYGEEITKEKLIQYRSTITTKFREHGFTYISMDLQGYRTGSMNKTLTKQQEICLSPHFWI